MGCWTLLRNISLFWNWNFGYEKDFAKNLGSEFYLSIVWLVLNKGYEFYLSQVVVAEVFVFWYFNGEFEYYFYYLSLLYLTKILQFFCK